MWNRRYYYREKIKKAACWALIIILLPYIVTVFVNGPKIVTASKVDEMTIDVKGGGKMPVEKYCIGILARDMPAEYEEEALKAQAILVRTEVYRAIRDAGEGQKLEKEFWTEKQMKSAWGMRYAENYRKLKNALESTAGQVLFYEDGLAMTPFFNLSNGYTRDAKEVLGKEEYPYLKIVECPEDVNAEEADGKHVLLYTGVSQKDGKEIQNQCIAIGDGKTYEKWQDNPVIKGDIMPEKFDRKDFRDPKIWKKNGRYYCVVGNRYEENCGQIVLFSSADYKNWRYEKVLLRNDGKNGDMLECPDYLEVDGYPVIICSPQNMHAQKYEFHNGHNSIYIIGDAEKEISDFAWEKKRNLDYGLDFYAPQTTELPDGRRIMVAWMKSWDARVMTKGQKWQGMMTLPRELKIKDGKIWQSPVRELEKYKKNPTIYTEQKISGQMSLDGINGRVIDMTVEPTNVEGREFKVDVAHNEEYTTTFTYYPEKHQIEIDRTYSGVNADVVCVRKIEIAEKHHAPKLHFIMDRYSVELFINDGEQTASVVIPTPLEANEIIFTSDEAATVNIEKYEITFN